MDYDTFKQPLTKLGHFSMFIYFIQLQKRWCIKEEIEISICLKVSLVFQDFPLFCVHCFCLAMCLIVEVKGKAVPILNLIFFEGYLVDTFFHQC